MKKQYLFGALAFSAIFASCNNDSDAVLENTVKQEALMEEIVGADLVANGLSIKVENGVESRALNGEWLPTDKLGLAWYNVVKGKSIFDPQTMAAWNEKNTEDNRIYANHKFVPNETGEFVTESNVYQGGHFVYFPYNRESEVKQKNVSLNAAAYTVKPEGDLNPSAYAYDYYNKAFYLSAQDFITVEDVVDGVLKSKFVMSPMANAINVHVDSKVEGNAVKALKVKSVSIASNSPVFADEFAVVPKNVPFVELDVKGEPDPNATTIELDKYAKTLGASSYKEQITRTVAAGFDLTAATNNFVLYTLPTHPTANPDKDQTTVVVNVESEHGLQGTFTVQRNATETDTNNDMLETLTNHFKNSLRSIRRSGGKWQPLNTRVELTNDNVEIVYSIANKNQWDDAVALAADLGKNATFTLTDDVEFTESVNFPAGINLTVVSASSKKMLINGDIEWPNNSMVNVSGANIEVKHGAKLTINGVEENRNKLLATVVNNGSIVLNEYAKIATVENNNRIEVKYGSYVTTTATKGIIAYNIEETPKAYKINNLISDDLALVDRATVNTLVVNYGRTLDLNMIDDEAKIKDPYTGEYTINYHGVLASSALAAINIEMNGGTLKGALGDVEPVNNVNVISGTTNKIVDVDIEGNLIVENDAEVIVDASQNTNGFKLAAQVAGDVENDGILRANTSIIIAKTLFNESATSELYVNNNETVWYTIAYKQGGLVKGSVLKYVGSYEILSATPANFESQTVSGKLFDGNGYELVRKEAKTDAGLLNLQGNTAIKNLSIDGGNYRTTTDGVTYGIYQLNNEGDVYIDNVTVKGVGYAFNVTGTAGSYNMVVSNSTFYGWVSYADVFESAKWVNCNFKIGTFFTSLPANGNFKPYATTELVNCNFDEKFGLDLTAIGDNTLTLKDCYVGSTKITAYNYKTLLTVDGTAAQLSKLYFK